jgi:hypothetical protein
MVMMQGLGCWGLLDQRIQGLVSNFCIQFSDATMAGDEWSGSVAANVNANDGFCANKYDRAWHKQW